jgi:hypothetical protein
MTMGAMIGDRTWSEVLEATGPLIKFLESVSDEVEKKWKGSVAPTMYGITADGLEVLAAIQREGRRDVPEVPYGLSWAQFLHGKLELKYGPLAARVAVAEAWMVSSDRLLDVRPSEHPDRKEMVMLEALCMRSRGKLHGRREIIRKNGKAKLGPLLIAERDELGGTVH